VASGGHPPPVTFADLPALWRLERACFGAEAWGIVELGLALLTPAVRLKVMDGGRPVGFALAERNWWRDESTITLLGVHPHYQRRGLGRQLLAAAEAQLNTRCYKLTVRVGNVPAIALYEHCGYRRVSRVAHYYPRGEDGWVMEKISDADKRHRIGNE
jgi:ribosomal-protein-alanine N-acetyltransferase